MASIFYREKAGLGLWWIKTRSAGTREVVRASLKTRDEAMALLIKRRVELELELRSPELRHVEIPDCSRGAGIAQLKSGGDTGVSGASRAVRASNS